MLAAFLGLCGGEPPAPRFNVLLIDGSTSATADQKNVAGAAARSFLAAAPPPGSAFEVWVTGCGLDASRIHEVSVPAAWGPSITRRQKEWREGEEKRLDDLKLPPAKRCSPIAEGIFKAAARLREREGVERRLWIVSDLRQVSELGNFERRRIPKPEAFVRTLQANVPADLRGAQVVVCGVHDRPTRDNPRWPAAKAKALREAWLAAFAAMNASPVPALAEVCPWSSGTLSTVEATK